MKHGWTDHGFTEEQWSSFFDGPCPPPLAARITAHIGSCEECGLFAVEMRAVEQRLQNSAEQLRSSVAPTPWQIMDARDRTLARLAPPGVSARLGVLHHLLASMCGVETSSRAICKAALRASAPSPRSLTEKLWPGFLEQLRQIVESLCGEPAARLIWERGMALDLGIAL